MEKAKYIILIQLSCHFCLKLNFYMRGDRLYSYYPDDLYFFSWTKYLKPKPFDIYSFELLSTFAKLSPTLSSTGLCRVHYVHYVHNMYTICTLYVHYMYTLCTLYVHTMYTHVHTFYNKMTPTQQLVNLLTCQ